MFFCQKILRYDTIFSSSFFRRSKYAQSLRSKILHLSIKKNHQKILKMKKVRATLRKKTKKIPEIFGIFEIFRFFHDFTVGLPIVNFRKHRKFSKM